MGKSPENSELQDCTLKKKAKTNDDFSELFLKSKLQTSDTWLEKIVGAVFSPHSVLNH